MTKISVVTSLYKSRDYVHDFYNEYRKYLAQLGVDYEFVFVDDGSPDDSAARVKELIKMDPKVKLVVFSRNFGQYPAMFAAIANASGDLIFTSDCDLEEGPENILTFYETMKKDEEKDVLYGIVKERTGGFVKGFLGRMFFNLLRWGSDVNIPHNMSWQILMKQRYAKVLVSFKETETLPAGLMMLTGFNAGYIYIEKSYKGSTTYTFRKRIKLAFNSITAFSSKPLLSIGLLGLAITIISFTGVLVAIFLKLFVYEYQPGWISIILSIWLIGGLMLSSIGVVGIYLAKVFNQVKNRPLYIIREIL